jgi:hypothetical protein
MYSFLANLILIVHLTFVVFVLFGGLLVWKKRWIAWFHLPAAAWGIAVEFSGWTCPLTVLENWLREQGGEAGYQASFVAELLLPILYPDDLTHEVQHTLGTLVVASIVSMYCWLWIRSRVALVREESGQEERTEM